MRSTAQLVTVLLPVYNGARFLQEALDSILTQTFGDFELLVVDGKSDDGTLDILNSINDRRLRIMSERLNLIDSLNVGLEHARGKYIARMDADDVAEPLRLETQVQFLETHPEVVLLGSNASIIGANGEFLGRTFMPQASWWIGWVQFFSHAFLHPSVMFSRGFVVEHRLRYGQVPAGDTCFHALPSNQEGEDYLFWILISRRGRVCNLPPRLIRVRQHQTNKSRVHDQETQAATSEISLWNVCNFLECSIPRTQWWTASFELDPSGLRYWIARLADLYSERNRLSAAQAAVIRQDAEFRIRLAAGAPQSAVQRLYETANVLIGTAFPRESDQWRSALRFIMGSGGYGRLKQAMRVVESVRPSRKRV
jgi:hypothetical protein